MKFTLVLPKRRKRFNAKEYAEYRRRVQATAPVTIRNTDQEAADYFNYFPN